MARDSNGIKTVTLAGWADYRIARDVRLRNGSLKTNIKSLEKFGCKNVTLFQLPNPMSEAEALKWLADNHGYTPPQPAPKPEKAKKIGVDSSAAAPDVAIVEAPAGEPITEVIAESEPVAELVEA